MLVVLCVATTFWALLLPLWGGIAISVGFLKFSSRNPWNPALFALVSALAACVLSRPDPRRAVRDDVAWWTQLAARAARPVAARWSRLRWIPTEATAAAAVALVAWQWAGGRPLWLDEEMIAINVRERPLLDLAGPLWLGQSAPFGWLALQRAATLAFGSSEQVLRLVPALFGAATVGVAVWVGRRWMGPAGAMVLVLLCAFGEWISFFALELKPYSADIFWALLLPALAAWVLDTAARAPARRTRGAAIWWSVAAVGQWFANGAVFVTPPAALTLAIVWRRRYGWRAAFAFAGFGLVWLASFGAHYVMAIRHTVNSPFLTTYWSFALPPANADAVATVRWLAAQVEALAFNPGGTEWWAMFWWLAAAGWVLGARTPLGALAAAIPPFAFVLAALHRVPLYQRLSLWIVPALYIGIALFTQRSVQLGRDAHAGRHRWRLVVAIAAVGATSYLCADIAGRGFDYLTSATLRDGNHELDDRAGVQWLMRQLQPGDALLTTHLALPALWWYGAIPIADSEGGGSRHPDGHPVIEVAHRSDGPDCERYPLADALRGRSRALVYFGFRFDDVPRDFDDRLLSALGNMGRVTAFRQFTPFGRAAVVDLRLPPAAEPGPATARSGCVIAIPARRW